MQLNYSLGLRILDGACDMTGAPAGPAKQNPLCNSQLVPSLSTHRIAAVESDIPGGPIIDDSLIGFMKRKEKYLNFGTKSSIEISSNIRLLVICCFIVEMKTRCGGRW